MTDISTADRNYRSEMTEASQKLLQAITFARKGINPATPTGALKLPPVGNERGLSSMVSAERAKHMRAVKNIPPTERMVQLYEAGATAGEIAAILKTSHQKVSAVLKAKGI